MKTGLLLSVAFLFCSEANAACMPELDCASLGYKYSYSQCGGKGLACLYDSGKYFCPETVSSCTYQYTKADCAAECKNVGSLTCSRNGTTYYASCGSSKCSSGQICSNGTCKSPVATSGYCCGYSSYCGYSGGTSSSYDSECQESYGRTCYEQCKYDGYPDCTDMQASCKVSGGTPVFQGCDSYSASNYLLGVDFACQ